MTSTNHRGAGVLVTGTPALRGERVTKSFNGITVLDSLDLSVQPGEIHALLGGNGSGKSTFIKILSGYHRPDSGVIQIGGKQLEFGSPDNSVGLGCRFVHQDLGLIDELSVVDNLAIGFGFDTRWGSIRPAASRRAARDDLARVGLDVDERALVSTLSPATRTGVALARAIRQRPDEVEPQLLVLDEPTATLPQNEVDHLLSLVRAAASNHIAVLYVTHRLDEVFGLTDNISVLRSGQLVATVPTTSLNRHELVTMLVGAETESSDEETNHSTSAHIGDPLLTASAITAEVLDNVDLEAWPGEIVGISGITGSGREDILPAIFGGVMRTAGTVRIAGKTVPAHRPDLSMAADIAYVPAERIRHGCIIEQSARENLTLTDLRPFWRHGLLRRRAESAETKQWFDRLSIKPPTALEQPLSSLSGGNQQKVVFAKWLRRKPQVFLLDEPTQGVDVGARAELHRELKSIADTGSAVIVSSSDIDELVDLCTRVLIMRGGRITDTVIGAQLTAAELARLSLPTQGQGSS